MMFLGLLSFLSGFGLSRGVRGLLGYFLMSLDRRAPSDGEERLVVDGFHDQGGAGLIAIWEGEVVDAHTSFTVILLEGVSFDP